MSAISDEIKSLEAELHRCLDNDDQIDPKKIKRLFDLRRERLTELANTHEQRLEIMKNKTLEWSGKIPIFTEKQMKLHAATFEKMQKAQEDYDKASALWVNSESIPWEESAAYEIAAGILVLANAIR